MLPPVFAAPPLARALPRPPAAAEDPLYAKARALESAFLSEMLRHLDPMEASAISGLSQESASKSFSGGAGEQQFRSFLRAEQAELLVERGGIGLAEQIYRALKSRTEAGGDAG